LHASIIAVEEQHQHETVHNYILEHSQNLEYGDICDIHHLFHWVAILPTHFNELSLKLKNQKLILIAVDYTPPFSTKEKKPPIL